MEDIFILKNKRSLREHKEKHMYLNSLNLIGRLVADPRFDKGSNEDGSNDRVWGRLAVARPGEQRDENKLFIPFSAWGAQARAVAEKCKKGKVLILMGKLKATHKTEVVMRKHTLADGTEKWHEEEVHFNYFECNCSAVHFGPDAGWGKKNSAAPVEATVEAPAQTAPVLDATMLKALAQLQQLQAQAQTAQATPASNPFDTNSIPV